jgi:ABC-type multidrug transport system fused ATPase/permease subunit
MVIARRGPRRRQGGQGAPLVKGRRPAGSAPALSFRRIFAFVAPYVIPRTREATCLAAASTMSTVLYKASLFLPGISGKLVIDAVSDGALAPADRRSRALAGVAVYFAGRLGAAVFSGLQDVTYERLSQDISRRFGAQTYEHLLRLDVSYHTTVPAGRSFDVLNRGIGALSLLLRVVTLQLGPTLVEAAVISSIFVRLGSRAVACTTFTSCAAYVWLTQAITKWRVGHQREIVRAENAVSSKAVETFSSFEAVKMFSTERREVGKYETLRYELQEASVKTRWLICAFHFGQNVIMGLGLVLGMLLTIHDGASKLA